MKQDHKDRARRAREIRHQVNNARRDADLHRINSQRCASPYCNRIVLKGHEYCFRCELRQDLR